MDSSEQESLVYRLADEVWNRGNLAVVDELFAPTFAGHSCTLPHGEQAGGRTAYKAQVAEVRRAFPDLGVTIEELLADGVAVAVRFGLRGSNTGVLPSGEAATGRRAQWTCQTICHMAEGRVTELWSTVDRLALREQLGLL